MLNLDLYVMYALSLPTVTSVIIMSSIMEHMCADVFQQTGATLRPPMEGQEPIPYRNLLPAKDPIHMALSKQFQMVLCKSWVDSRALHLFESLLNMGGVFWFTNNLVKVGGLWECPTVHRLSVNWIFIPLISCKRKVGVTGQLQFNIAQMRPSKLSSCSTSVEIPHSSKP